MRNFCVVLSKERHIFSTSPFPVFTGWNALVMAGVGAAIMALEMKASS